MGELRVRLLRGDVAIVRAVTSEAFGYEIPFVCQGCEDSPFPLCVAGRNSACLNCIYTGSDLLCYWRKSGDYSAVGGKGYNAVDENYHLPSKIQRLSGPFTESFYVPPRTQRVRRKRSNPDSDSDFVPPKRRKPYGSNDIHDYLPPKTRNTSSRGAKHNPRSPNQEARSPTEPNDKDVVVIDLTGDN
jgi:hypothetical protein